MIRRMSQLNTPLMIFGTPRCFSPNTSRITRIQKKNAITAASSMVDSSRFDLRITGRNRNSSISAPITASTSAEAISPTMNGNLNCATIVWVMKPPGTTSARGQNSTHSSARRSASGQVLSAHIARQGKAHWQRSVPCSTANLENAGLRPGRRKTRAPRLDRLPRQSTVATNSVSNCRP